ncbi:hypothetical protein TUM20903_03050 [Citrobacter koseri]|nr:hypothetical protein TUM13189_02770 [Citrobacter koseri]BDG87567.1 hypothetical protein TUM20903_03050 [Citrobacter koseri]
MTILLGYNTPIIEALQGSTQAPYLDSRRAVAQKQLRDLRDGTSGSDDIIHNDHMESLYRQFKAKRIFQVMFAQSGAEMVLSGGGAKARDASAVPAAAQPARQGATQQIALVKSPAPVTALPERHAD